VVVASRSDYSEIAAEMGLKYYSLHDPAAFFEAPLDVVLFSVSIVSFEKTLTVLAPYMEGKGLLVVDVLSVKEHPATLLDKYVPKDCDILATHPMFGPESGGGPNGWRGLTFVYDAVRVADRPQARDRVERFLSVFDEQGCRMVPMTSAQHDQFAAESQFVTHLVGRMLGHLSLKPTPIDTKGFESLLGVVKNTNADSFDLFFGLYKYNENNAKSIINGVQASLEVTVGLLEEQLHKEAETLGKP